MTPSTHKDYLQQARRVGRHMLWLLQDCVAAHRRTVIGIVVASVGGVLLQGAVLGVIFMYTRMLETNQVLRISAWAVESRSETAVLLIGALSLVFFTASAWLIYLAKNWIADVSVRHEQYCSRIVLERVSARPFQVVENHAVQRVVGALLSEQTLNARGCGRAVQTLLATAYPLVIMVYMFAFLAYLNLEVTLLMLCLFGVFMGALYRLNVSVVDNEFQIKTQQDAFRRELRRLVMKLLPLSRIHASLSGRIDAVYRQPSVQGMFERIKSRRVSLARADLIGNVSIALALAFTLVWLGQMALQDHIAWGQVIVYVVALRVAVGGARSVLIAATTLARWYPYVREFHHLTGRGSSAVAPAPAGEFVLTVQNQRGVGDLSQAVLRAGDRVGVISPVELTRFTFFHFIDGLLGAGAEQRQWLLQQADFVPARPAAHDGETLRGILHLPAEATWSDLRAMVPEFSFIHWLEEWSGGDLDKEVTPGGMRGMRRKKLVKLALFASAFRQDPVLMVAAGALDRLSERARARWFELVAGKLLILHYGEDLAAVGTHGEGVVIVGNRTGQCALAGVDWVRANAATLAKDAGVGVDGGVPDVAGNPEFEEVEESDTGGL